MNRVFSYAIAFSSKMFCEELCSAFLEPGIGNDENVGSIYPASDSYKEPDAQVFSIST